MPKNPEVNPNIEPNPNTEPNPISVPPADIQTTFYGPSVSEKTEIKEGEEKSGKSLEPAVPKSLENIFRQAKKTLQERRGLENSEPSPALAKEPIIEPKPTEVRNPIESSSVVAIAEPDKNIFSENTKSVEALPSTEISMEAPKKTEEPEATEPSAPVEGSPNPIAETEEVDKSVPVSEEDAVKKIAQEKADRDAQEMITEINTEDAKAKTEEWWQKCVEDGKVPTEEKYLADREENMWNVTYKEAHDSLSATKQKELESLLHGGHGVVVGATVRDLFTAGLSLDEIKGIKYTWLIW
jgi:hypothetical protein